MDKNLIPQALQHHKAGRLGEAKNIYDHVLILYPQHPDALYLRGLIALQTGEAEAAVGYLRKATKLQPKNVMFRGNLATALMQIGDLEGAEAAFRRAIDLDSNQAQFHLGFANCLALRGKLAQAEQALRRLTQRFPQFALAWFNLGNSIADQGRNLEAVEFYQRAIAIDPALSEARNNLGAILLAIGRSAEAEAVYREALRLRPDDTKLLCNLASLLIDLGRFAEAENQCRRAIALIPDLSDAYTILGAAIGHQGRLVSALEMHRKAAALAPQNARIRSALGIALYETGEVKEGLELLAEAIQMGPDLWEARVSLGNIHLAEGRFEQGWEGYYHRTGRLAFPKQHPGVPIASSLPASLAGKHICLLNEQGLGDQLFLLRWLPALKAQGVTVSYKPDPKLESIVRRITALDHCVPSTDALPDADFYFMLGDLPCYLSRGMAAEAESLCPASLPLMPLAEHLRAMREQLSKLGPPPYIGITWRGGTPPEEQHGAMSWMLFKEVPLAQLAGALSDVKGTLIALQRKPGAGEIDQLRALLPRPLHDLSEANGSLEDMLALLTLLDEYIGVSNTNIHLRAALGRTARVLLPCPAEWRWMTNGDESPWFPGFQVYRQSTHGEWSAALQSLANDLSSLPSPARP